MRVAITSLAWVTVCSVAQAATLTGVVLREDGTAAPRATVNVAAVFKSPPLRLTATAAEDGTFQIDLPKLSGSEYYELTARWNNQGVEILDAYNAKGKRVGLSGQKLPSITVRLRSAGRLHGRLLRAEDDGPLANARLFLDTGDVLTTNADGAFELNGLSMKDHSLIPVAPGRVRQYVLFDSTLRPDTELELRLPRGAVIRGRITDEAGEPIPNAYLTRSSSGTALTLNGWDEPCQPDGTFEFGGLSPQRLFYSVEACAPGYENQEISAEVDDPDAVIQKDIRLIKKSARKAKSKPIATATATEKPADPTVELPRKTVTGIVRDGEGEPIEGATVRWANFIWDPSVESVKTNEAGNFSLLNVPEGRGAVMVVARTFAPQFLTLPTTNEPLEISLSPGATVRGVVKNLAGRPVPRVRIIPLTHCTDTGFCNPIWLDERETETNEQGEFEIAALPTIGVEFDFLKDGYSERRNVSLKTDAANEIQLQTGGAVRGRVLDATGNPVRNFNLRVMIPRGLKPGDPAGGYYAGFDWYGVTYTSDDGVFVMTDIPANSWLRLIAKSPGKGCTIVERAKSEPLDALSPAENLTIHLLPWTPFSVKILDAKSQQPIAKAHVALLEDIENASVLFRWGYDDLWAERAFTNAEGEARFAEPACHDGMVIVQAPGYARQRVSWHKTSSQLTLSLQPGATLQGEVRLGDQLLAEGFLRLTSTADSLTVNLQEKKGRFEIDQLPAGEYELSVSGKTGRSLYSSKLRLEAGETKTENVVIVEGNQLE